MQNRNPRRATQQWYLWCPLAAMILGVGAAQTQAQCIEEQKLTASDAAGDDYFGRSVSVSGNTAVVGASQAESYSGSAYVFGFDGTSWVEKQELTAADTLPNDLFGASVSISGDTAIVGAPNGDDEGLPKGSAYVFRFDGTSWAEEQKLTASDAAGFDKFGTSVSVSGNTVIVGAWAKYGPANRSGAAYVFRFDGASWVEEQKLTASDAASQHFFGWSVSVSGDAAIVGAWPDESVYAFRFDGTNWVEEQKLTASDAEAYDKFGESVSISGDTVIVGALGNSDDGTESGSAYVFAFDGTNWVEAQKLTASDGAEWDRFGNSVSVSGETAVVGAYDDHAPAPNSGSAYVFRFDGTSWIQAGKLTASDGAEGDRFGNSVAVSEDTAFVGAYWDDDHGSRSGSAYVFNYTCIDNDCDGFPGDAACNNGVAQDCNDSDPAVFPGNSESFCNGIDDDCDPGTVDDPDGDGDSVGVCTDCNDSDPGVFPGNSESLCNGIDDDCDPGTADDPDGDSDGVGVCTDCNDDNPGVYPGNAEIDCNGIDDDCDPTTPDDPGDCEVFAPLAAIAPHNVSKNRYLSFQPNNTATVVGFEIALPDGRTGWVDAPELVDWGGIDPSPVSLVVDVPVFRVWSESTIHVVGCAITPDAVYVVSATTDGEVFTADLRVATVPTPTVGSWADIVGSFDNGAQTWSPPNGFVNFQDIDAAVKKFQVNPAAPHVTVVDLHPQWPNYFVNFSDIDMVIKGFQSVPYPVPASDCQMIANCPLGGAAGCLP